MNKKRVWFYRMPRVYLTPRRYRLADGYMWQWLRFVLIWTRKSGGRGRWTL